MKPREDSKAMADLATRFVNLKTKDAVRQFVEEHAGDIRSFPLIFASTTSGTERKQQQLEKDVSVLVDTIHHLRSAWTHKTYDGWLDAEKTLRGILFSVRVAQFGRGVVTVDHGTPEREDIWARPAVELAPYRKSRKQVNFFFRFKRRDVLDEIAYAILVALRRGYLKMCKGHTKHPEWNCQTPFLVADEGRRDYCYGACGEKTQSERAKEWHRTHAKKRRRLAA